MELGELCVGDVWFDGRHAASPTIRSDECVNQGVVVRTMARRLDNDVAREAKVIAQGEELILTRVARRVLAFFGEGELARGAKDVTVRVHRTLGYLEVWFRGIGFEAEPIVVDLEGFGTHRPCLVSNWSRRG